MGCGGMLGHRTGEQTCTATTRTQLKGNRVMSLAQTSGLCPPKPLYPPSGKDPVFLGAIPRKYWEWFFFFFSYLAWGKPHTAVNECRLKQTWYQIFGPFHWENWVPQSLGLEGRKPPSSHVHRIRVGSTGHAQSPCGPVGHFSSNHGPPCLQPQTH